MFTKLILARRTFSTATTVTKKLFPAYQVPLVPGAGEALQALGEAEVDSFVQKGNFSLAEESCRRILEICSHINNAAPESGARCKLAKIYEYMGSHDKAAVQWNHVIASKADLGPTAANVKVAHIWSLLRSGQSEQALTVAKKWADVYAKDDRFKFLQAVACFRQKQFSESLNLLQNTNEHSSIYGNTLLLKGTCLVMNHEREKGLEVFRSALKHFETHENELGVIAACLQLQDQEQSQRALKLVEKFDPNHPLVADALRVLASQVMFDPIVSEGLFRSAVGRCTNHSHYVPTYLTQCIYASCLSDYGYLLCHLQWNGQSRAKAALSLLKTPVLFGGLSYSRGYMREQNTIKMIEEADATLPQHLASNEQKQEPALSWWMSEVDLSRGPKP